VGSSTGRLDQQARLLNGRHDYRAAPLTTKSTSRSPQIRQRRKRAQSGTGIVVPCWHDLACLEPAAIARLGVSRTFQQAAPLLGLTVMENVVAGMHLHYKSGIAAVLLGWLVGRLESAPGILNGRF
jgi:hypothetical protein